MYEKFAEKFLWALKAERRISKNTQNAYKKDLEIFIKFFSHYKKEDKSNVLQDFFEQHPQSSATMQRRLSTIKQFLQFCEDEGLLKVGFFETPKIQQSKHFPIVLVSEDLNIMRQNLGYSPKDIRLKAIIEILYSTGMRISELLSLKMNETKEIFTKKSLIIKGKGSKERIVFFSDFAIAALKEYIGIQPIFGNSEYLWASKNKAITRQRINQMLKELAIKCEIDEERIFPHSFRHRLLTDLVKGGADLVSVQRIAGHKRISTTEKYTHMEDHLYDEISKHHPLNKA